MSDLKFITLVLIGVDLPLIALIIFQIQGWVNLNPKTYKKLLMVTILVTIISHTLIILA